MHNEQTSQSAHSVVVGRYTHTHSLTPTPRKHILVEFHFYTTHQMHEMYIQGGRKKLSHYRIFKELC